MSDDHGRRAAFIAAWRAHGNVRRAMRETGVGSPTTAYRWIRAHEQHGPLARYAVTRPAPRIAPEIADQVIAMRQDQPTWGKERIARRLAERHGRPVISATGVRSVLREAGLWTPPRIPRHVPAGARGIDTDWLTAELERGIRLDLHDRPREAAVVLNAAVWTPLLRQPELIPTLLREPVTGSWLLRGALQLAHALIDTGRWASSLWYLRLIDEWLRREDARLDARQAAYQDEGERWLADPDGDWRTGGGAPSGAGRISLRHDDIWLETQQYLGVVLRDAPGEAAIDALADARHALRGRTGRRYLPDRRLHYRGVIAHDIAALEQRGGYPLTRVLADLDEAEVLLRARDNRDFLASAAVVRARAIARAGGGPDQVEEAVWTAFERGDDTPTLIIGVKVAIDGAELLLDLRALAPDELARLPRKATLDRHPGRRFQARKLVWRERLLAQVPDLEAALRELAGADA